MKRHCIKYCLIGCCLQLKMGCYQTSPDFWEVRGTAKGLRGERLALVHIDESSKQKIALDTTHANAEGVFMLKAPMAPNGLYQLEVNNRGSFLLINDRRQLHLRFHVDSMADYQVSKSPASKHLQVFYQKLYNWYIPWVTKRDTLVGRLEKAAVADSIRALWRKDLKEVENEAVTQIGPLLRDAKHPLAAGLILGTCRPWIPEPIWQNWLTETTKVFTKEPDTSWKKWASAVPVDTLLNIR